LAFFWPYFNDCDTEVKDTCLAMLKNLEKIGAQIVEIEIPNLLSISVAHIISFMGEGVTRISSHVEESPSEFTCDLRIKVSLGKLFSCEDYARAQLVRSRAMKDLDIIFQQCDAIITPITACLPTMYSPTMNEVNDITLVGKIIKYSFLSNLTGIPSISFPAGYSNDGLPIGIQAMGKWWNENLLLRIAQAAEPLIDRKKPVLHYSVL